MSPSEVNTMSQPLKQSVEEALQAYSPLRTSKAQITVTTDEDKVTLAGYVPSGIIKRMAAVLAGSVEGVSEVINNLSADPELEHAVSAALANDSRTRAWPIRVRAALGYVQLQGNVPDEAAVQTALEVARQATGPRQIISALAIGRPVLLAT
jgi:osmotically-inducible protein OsmY